MYTHTHTLTALHDAAEDGVVSVERAAVPAVVAKLVLALPHAQTGALDHLLHDLRLGLAQLGVFAPQAPGLPADAVVVHHQWATQHPERMTQRERERERE